MHNVMSAMPLILLNTVDAAEHLRLAPQTLYRWRSEGKGPSYRKIGSRVFYTPDAIVLFLASTTRTKTRDEP